MSEETQVVAPGEQPTETAQENSQVQGEQAEGSKFDLSNLDPGVQKYIKSLRQEAASHRTTANQVKAQFEDLQGRIQSVFGGEEESIDPQEAVVQLQSATQELSFKNAILSEAVNHGIPATGIPYFEFLIQQATMELEEGEELSQDTMSGILAEVKQKSGPMMMQSSVKTPQSAPDTRGEMTVQQFSKLGMSERTKLYQTNPQKYADLMAEWKKTIR
jgi:hypothetical protein